MGGKKRAVKRAQSDSGSQSEFSSGPLSGGKVRPRSARDLASPDEGAALIRAFLRIDQRNVREAIIELVNRLSGTSP
jgi:hypothetical protein